MGEIINDKHLYEKWLSKRKDNEIFEWDSLSINGEAGRHKAKFSELDENTKRMFFVTHVYQNIK